MPHMLLIGLSLCLAAYMGLLLKVISRERSGGQVPTCVTLESEDAAHSRRAA